MSTEDFKRVIEDRFGETVTVYIEDDRVTLSPETWDALLDPAAARELARALTDAADLIDPPAASEATEKAVEAGIDYADWDAREYVRSNIDLAETVDEAIRQALKRYQELTATVEVTK